MYEEDQAAGILEAVTNRQPLFSMTKKARWFEQTRSGIEASSLTASLENLLRSIVIVHVCSQLFRAVLLGYVLLSPWVLRPRVR